jgi:hypothetical protein
MEIPNQLANLSVKERFAMITQTYAEQSICQGFDNTLDVVHGHSHVRIQFFFMVGISVMTTRAS